MSLAETVQYILRVVTDRSDVDAMWSEPGSCILQLDELRSAVGSPICATRKDQQ
jgi:hypothetical protein